MPPAGSRKQAPASTNAASTNNEHLNTQDHRGRPTTSLFHGPYWLLKPRPGELQAILDAAAGQHPSYAEIGATRDAAVLPLGYHQLETSIDLGSGPERFEGACAALRRWAPQRHAGMELLPPEPPQASGQNFVLLFRTFPFFVNATGRIVYTVDEANRYGFAYGTLPSHPEQGEEAFFVQRSPDGQVSFRIRAFSRPGQLLTRLG
ncbi:MAG: DUF1990 family protein, partial [Actinomycetota bacterium]